MIFPPDPLSDTHIIKLIQTKKSRRRFVYHTLRAVAKTTGERRASEEESVKRARDIVTRQANRVRRQGKALTEKYNAMRNGPVVAITYLL
jgi:hypothetical protein